MSVKAHKILLLILLLTAGLAAKAQRFSNDFENQYTWYPPWTNIRIAADTLLVKDTLVGTDTLAATQPVSFDTVVNYRCVCLPDQEFGLGFSYAFPDSLNGRNLHLAFGADYRFPDTLFLGKLVFSIDRGGQNLFWQSYDLNPYANDSAAWFRVPIELNFPADHLPGSTINVYLWNEGKQHILIDNATVTLTPWSMPSFLPETPKVENDPLSTFNYQLSTPHDSLPLTHPIGMLTEYILDGDTVTVYQLFNATENGTTEDSPNEREAQWKVENELLETLLTQTTHLSSFQFHLSTRFKKDALLLRQALVVPFIDSTLTVYRKNQTVDSVLFQSEYYLDREGFQVGEGERTLISYHPCYLSSTQLDAVHRVAYFNLDYWRDHPRIHYPLSDTLEDVFEEVSARRVYEGMEWFHPIELYVGDEVPNLPRIMPIPYGYESGIIWTEHADWTDLRTHRAVLFGSEKITKAKDATGGFVYYGIPVTKSVFYNNPENITNAEMSQGTFQGLQTTIKTHREFEKLLKQLHKLGFDLCLHTPEQHTTTPSNLKEALDYMQRHFKSTTWIDHGYNNGPKKNREDLVCDGLNPQSEAYAGDEWRRHGIKYLWNAYYEENRMEPWCFNNNLIQPYPGFGDALPNRQVTPIAGYDYRHGSLSPIAHPQTPPDLLTWSTPSTLEATSDLGWDFFFSEERLQKLIDQHNVSIIHAYPAWVVPGRTFWTYDQDSTIVALPGMNRAFERIASLRDEHKLLPMTVKTYLDYYSGLLHVSYTILDSQHIQLHNAGDEVKGFTLLCTSPIRFKDNRYYEFRKSGNEYYLWFTLKPHDTVTLEIRPSDF